MSTVKELKAHIDAQTAQLKADLDKNKDAIEKRLGDPAPTFEAPPLAAGSFVDGVGGAVGGVVSGVGNVVGGVAGTGADAIGVVGTVADSAHNAIDGFFHNIRVRLGI